MFSQIISKVKIITLMTSVIFLASFSFSSHASGRCEASEVKYDECTFNFQNLVNGETANSQFQGFDFIGSASAVCEEGTIKVETASCKYMPKNASALDCAGISSNTWVRSNYSCFHDFKKEVVNNGQTLTVESDNGRGSIDYTCESGFLIPSNFQCGSAGDSDQTMISPLSTSGANSQFACTEEDVFVSFSDTRIDGFDGSPRPVNAQTCDIPCAPFSSGSGFNYVKNVTSEGFDCSCDCKYDFSFSDSSADLDACKGAVLGTETEALLSGVPYLCGNGICYQDDCASFSGSSNLCQTCSINNLTVPSVSDNIDNQCIVTIDDVYSGTNKNQDFISNDYHGQVSYYCMNGTLDLQSIDCYKTCNGETLNWGVNDASGSSYFLGIDRSIACQGTIPTGNYRHGERVGLKSTQNSGKALYQCNGETGQWVTDPTQEECKLTCPSTAFWFDKNQTNVYDRADSPRQKGYDSMLNKLNPVDPDRTACSFNVPASQREHGSSISATSTGINKGSASLTCNDGYWEVNSGSCNLHCDDIIPSIDLTGANGRTCSFPSANAARNRTPHNSLFSSLNNTDLFNNGSVSWRCNDGGWDVDSFTCEPKECAGSVSWGSGLCQTSLSGGRVCQGSDCNRTTANINTFSQPSGYTGSATFECRQSNASAGQWVLVDPPAPTCVESYDGRCPSSSNMPLICDRGTPSFIESFTDSAFIYETPDEEDASRRVANYQCRDQQCWDEGFNNENTIKATAESDTGYSILDAPLSGACSDGEVVYYGDYSFQENQGQNEASGSYGVYRQRCVSDPDSGGIITRWRCLGQGIGSDSDVCESEQPNNCATCSINFNTKCESGSYNNDFQISGGSATWTCGENAGACSVANCAVSPAPKCATDGTVSCESGTRVITSLLNSTSTSWNCVNRGVEVSCPSVAKPINNAQCAGNHGGFSNSLSLGQAACSAGSNINNARIENVGNRQRLSWDCVPDPTNHFVRSGESSSCSIEKAPKCPSSGSSICETGAVINNNPSCSSGSYCWTCRTTNIISESTNDRICSDGLNQVPAECGSAHESSVSSAPSSNLCETGSSTTPLFNSSDGRYEWDCSTEDGDLAPNEEGTTVPCHAILLSTGSCGSANNTVRNTPPSGASLCDIGTASSVSDDNTNDDLYEWSCTGSDNNPTSCQAYKTPVCNTSSPPTYTCNIGEPENINVNHPTLANWDCINSANTTCDVNKPEGDDGVCGSVSEGAGSTEPTSDLCSLTSSTPEVVFNSSANRWEWICSGSALTSTHRAGENARCHFDRESTACGSKIGLLSFEYSLITPDQGQTIDETAEFTFQISGVSDWLYGHSRDVYSGSSCNITIGSSVVLLRGNSLNNQNTSSICSNHYDFISMAKAPQVSDIELMRDGFRYYSSGNIHSQHYSSSAGYLVEQAVYTLCREPLSEQPNNCATCSINFNTKCESGSYNNDFQISGGSATWTCGENAGACSVANCAVSPAPKCATDGTVSCESGTRVITSLLSSTSTSWNCVNRGVEVSCPSVAKPINNAQCAGNHGGFSNSLSLGQAACSAGSNINNARIENVGNRQRLSWDCVPDPTNHFVRSGEPSSCSIEKEAQCPSSGSSICETGAVINNNPSCSSGSYCWTCRTTNIISESTNSKICSDDLIQVPAQCGSAHESNVSSAPSSNLCETGSSTTPLFNSSDGRYEWDCSTEDGDLAPNEEGTTVSCHANLLTTGSCGSANNTVRNTPPSGASLCDIGTASSVSDDNTNDDLYEWSCTGSDNNPTSCQAYKTPVCNTSSPPTYTCNIGEPENINVNHPTLANWDCINSANTTCDVNKPEGDDGVCGSVSGGTGSTEPTSNLCSFTSSTPNVVFNSSENRWEWICSGSTLTSTHRAGSNADCHFNRESTVCGSEIGLLTLERMSDTDDQGQNVLESQTFRFEISDIPQTPRGHSDLHIGGGNPPQGFKGCFIDTAGLRLFIDGVESSNSETDKDKTCSNHYSFDYADRLYVIANGFRYYSSGDIESSFNDGFITSASYGLCREPL